MRTNNKGVMIMSEKTVLEVQQGIWIDEQWLHDAGLMGRLQVELHPGEIRILPAPVAGDRQAPAEDGWEVFESLGDDAVPGKLPNASVEHDSYLYGKTQ